MLVLGDATAVNMLNKMTITLQSLQRRILCGESGQQDSPARTILLHIENQIRPLRSEELTPLDLPANVVRLSGVSSPSDHNEQRVFVGVQVEAGGSGSAPRLLLDLPPQQPAGRHVENLQFGVMSSAHE